MAAAISVSVPGINSLITGVMKVNTLYSSSGVSKNGKCRNDKEGRKEGNVLFNDALDTFYLRLYGIGHMVEDRSDNKRGRKEGRKCFI